MPTYYYTPELTYDEAKKIAGPDALQNVTATLGVIELAHARIHERAEAFIRAGILCCDSWLIPILGAAGEDGFGVEDWENLYPDQDADDWTYEECRDWLDTHALNYPTDQAGHDGETRLEEWRDAVRDADPCPAEPYEWWRVSPWLCRHLRDAGEVVIDNGYGHWWGRCVTGQGIIMDGTIQRIAHEWLASC